MNKKIPFSPPDITQLEIDEVVDTLKSGWLTTGPKTKRFESEIANYCNTEKAVCLNSATAGLELALRLFDIGDGDEVITTPYTYAATANVILHVGAKPVFVDIKENEFNIDPKGIEEAITERTKAVISVDYGGYPVDYDEINLVLEKNKNKFKPKKNTWQETLKRPIFISDSAHSFGATYKNKKIGGFSDFTVFSFHAVKNLTTGEGGAIAFNSIREISSEEIYKRLMLLSLHGQSKDAFDKMKAGAWQYTIEIPGYKCNMTDIMASIGLAQLSRYEKEILPKRKRTFEIYKKELKRDERFILPPFEDQEKETSYHLFPVRIRNVNEQIRAEIIRKMAEKGIALNVHFIPVVMHPAYTKLRYNIGDYKNTFKMYENEISLPIYPSMEEEDVVCICEELKKMLQ